MKLGDSIKFEFAGKKRDGVVHKVFPSTVYLKVDFERDKGKIVKRKLLQVNPKAKKQAGKKEKK